MIIELRNNLHQKFSNTEIFFILNRKIKIITTCASTANPNYYDTSINKCYIIHFPTEVLEICEVNFSEQEIFKEAISNNSLNFEPNSSS